MENGKTGIHDFFLHGRAVHLHSFTFSMNYTCIVERRHVVEIFKNGSWGFDSVLLFGRRLFFFVLKGVIHLGLNTFEYQYLSNFTPIQIRLKPTYTCL